MGGNGRLIYWLYCVMLNVAYAVSAAARAAGGASPGLITVITHLTRAAVVQAAERRERASSLSKCC